MSLTNRFRNPCRLRGFQFLTVTPASLSHNPRNRTCGAQPIQNHFGRASHATRQPPTQMTYTRHPALNRFQTVQRRCPAKTQKTVFQDGA